MASLINEKTGFRIQWVDGSGRRKGLRLGKALKLAAARVVCSHVEALVQAAATGTSVPAATLAWLASIADSLHEKLVAAGLTSPRAQATTLDAFVDQFLASGLHFKPRTKLNIQGTQKRMVAFFGDLPLKDMTPAKAESWLQHMRARGYADATIHRDLKRARQLFKRAIKHGLASGNPFDGIKGPKEVNEARKRYVPRATIAKCIEAAPDCEWRLILGLSRYAGLGCRVSCSS